MADCVLVNASMSRVKCTQQRLILQRIIVEREKEIRAHALSIKALKRQLDDSQSACSDAQQALEVLQQELEMEFEEVPTHEGIDFGQMLAGAPLLAG